MTSPPQSARERWREQYRKQRIFRRIVVRHFWKQFNEEALHGEGCGTPRGLMATPKVERPAFS